MKKYLFGAVFLIIWLWQSVKIVQNIYWYQMNPVAAFYMSFADDTLWAEEFSEKAFASIQEGETSETVQKVLGQPLKTEYLQVDVKSEFKVITNRYHKKGETIWYYSVGADGIGTASSDGNIHINFIVFDENMRVRKKVKSFNID